MPYAEPNSPMSPNMSSSGLSSLIHSPRSQSLSLPAPATSTLASKAEATKILHRALKKVEDERATQAESMETIKDDHHTNAKKEEVRHPGWSRRPMSYSSLPGSATHSGPSTPPVLPRRQTSSRGGSRQTSPLGTPMALEYPSQSGPPMLPRKNSSAVPSLSSLPGQFQSGIDRRGRKSEGLGLKGVSRQVRESQGSVSTVESSGPSTPMDEITLSLQRYAAEQEAAEKRKRYTRGRTTSQDLDVSVDPNDFSSKNVDGLPRRRSKDRVMIAEPVAEPSGGLPSPSKDKESVIPFPKSPAQETIIPQPASPLTSTAHGYRVINPRHPARTGPSLGLRRQPSSSLQLDIPATPPININDIESGASTPYALSYEGSRPTSSMIRKKSGELLKPALKVRSLSTPHLPLREEMLASKSAPVTPSLEDDAEYGSDRHKNVRFAGASGDKAERLESVVLFLREQKVTAVSKTADGEEGMFPPTDTETEADTDANEYAAFRRRRNAAAQAADEAERFTFAEGSSTVPKVRVDFSPPGREALQHHNVVLERVEMPIASEPLALRGTVLVKNVSFQKWVAVRFTLDDWQTVSEVSGTHVIHLPASTTGDEGWDRFSFSIKLDDFKRKLEEKRLMMCVRFSIEGKEWWDSGIDGNNYSFAFKRVKPVRRIRAMFEIGADAEPSPKRQTAVSTPPVPGTRGSGYGRATGWNFPGMGSPSGSPSKGVLGTVNKPSPPIATGGPSPDTPAFRNATFQPTRMSDVHDHLKLRTYCAPTPLLSPPKDEGFHATGPSAKLSPPRGRQMSMMVGGQYATSLAPLDSWGKGHERRRSWGGEEVDENDSAWIQATGGSPPMVVRPTLISRQSDDVDFRRGDPNMASNSAMHGLDLFTPPSSTLSTPPLISLPEVPESPSTDTASPASPSMATSPSGSNISLPEVVIDGAERDERLESRAQNNANSGIHSPSYKEFVEKFCFFESKTPVPPSPAQSRSATPTGMPSGHSNFNPFGAEYPSFGTSSQLSTPTGHPSGGGDNYFSYQPISSAWGRKTGSGANSTSSSGGSSTPSYTNNPRTFVSTH